MILFLILLDISMISQINSEYRIRGGCLVKSAEGKKNQMMFKFQFICLPLSDAPFVALIVIQDDEDHDPVACSGSILTETHVLTAAHCLHWVNDSFGDDELVKLLRVLSLVHKIVYNTIVEVRYIYRLSLDSII